ncbi:hypothetical protein E2C01_017102 [Portunus trituberculatus]|uniref:Uncharacterized protein n=1 Tax=Portunus trituberculatus TaxID=210409 RepID=A0A5B7DQQ3_PORTR|nr:hypothetical protein [Portunus trituberculatus]
MTATLSETLRANLSGRSLDFNEGSGSKTEETSMTTQLIISVASGNSLGEGTKRFKTQVAASTGLPRHEGMDEAEGRTARQGGTPSHPHNLSGASSEARPSAAAPPMPGVTFKQVRFKGIVKEKGKQDE